MTNAIERKRLKKKMLDRWENEGGRIVVDSAGAEGTGLTREHKSKSQPVSAWRGNPTVGRSGSPKTKKRKATQK